MESDNAVVVDRVLKWWSNRFPMVAGSRNANIFRLAAAFNNNGIPCADALEVCLRYIDLSGGDPFTGREITGTVGSAYRSTTHMVDPWARRKGERSYTAPTPPPRKLTAAQAQAVEDRLVELFRRQWQTVSTPPPPEDPPPMTPPPPILSRAEIAVKRMAGRNPAINTLVNLLDLDLSRARVRTL
jgi:hypothetical protein